MAGLMQDCLARADEADEKIARLHATVEEISSLMSSSKPAAGAGGGKELQLYQKEMLGKLRLLRDSLETERAPFAKMQAERDQAVAANAQVSLIAIYCRPMSF